MRVYASANNQLQTNPIDSSNGAGGELARCQASNNPNDPQVADRSTHLLAGRQLAGTPPTQESTVVNAANVAHKHAFPDVSFDSNGGMTLETFSRHDGMGAKTRDSCASQRCECSG